MKNVTDVTQSEAARLKAIYQDRKKANPDLSQEKLAEECGWSGQSVVSQYMNGKIPLNLSALLKFSKALGFNPFDVSPRLAEGFIVIDDVHKSQSGSLALDRSSPTQDPTGLTAIPLFRSEISPIEVWDDEVPLGADEVELPFFKEVELSAGNGSTVMLEENGRKLRFGKRTLQRKNIDPASAACVPVSGNSMEPVLPHGSTAGVNLADTKIIDGKMYAIDHDGQLRVKLIYSLPGFGLRLRSYNTEEYPDERYDGSYVRDHIRIIGKVWWYSVLL